MINICVVNVETLITSRCCVWKSSTKHLTKKKKKTPKTHGLVLGGVFSVSALIPYTE